VIETARGNTFIFDKIKLPVDMNSYSYDATNDDDTHKLVMLLGFEHMFMRGDRGYTRKSI